MSGRGRLVFQVAFLISLLPGEAFRDWGLRNVIFPPPPRLFYGTEDDVQAIFKTSNVAGDGIQKSSKRKVLRAN